MYTAFSGPKSSRPLTIQQKVIIIRLTLSNLLHILSHQVKCNHIQRSDKTTAHSDTASYILCKATCQYKATGRGLLVTCKLLVTL